jgi:hypothetical protein
MLKEVYFHTDSANRIFYIGSGIKGRAERLDLIGRGQDWLDYVEVNGFSAVHKVTSFIEAEDAVSLERALIKSLYTSEPLINKYWNASYKKKINRETRELQSQVRKGRKWTEAKRKHPCNPTRKGIKIARVSCAICRSEMGTNNFKQHIRNKHA